MKKNTLFQNIVAFTLIEVIITLTILGLIFGSVMSVFLLYSTLGSKVEVNRIMQSNIKTITEHIREDINENGITIGEGDHEIKDSNGDLYDDISDKLYVGESEYYIVRDYDFANNTHGNIVRTSDFSYCEVIQNNCTLIKKDENGVDIPLSNSWVSFKNINFLVSKDNIPKVTMFFEMSMAQNKGIRTDLVEGSSINIQTTMSQRITK